MSRKVSRRTVLRGLGATIALPWLDVMAGEALAAAGSAVAGATAAAPLRMAMIFLPNGMSFKDWTPTGTGTDYNLSATLAGLAPVKNDVLVMSGLALDNARAKGDGPGDHARSAAAFLTGAHPYKTAGSNIKVGVSVDQLAAQTIGTKTRLPSLELGLDKSQLAGDCDSGYSCAYVSNISWRSENTPMPKEVDPAAVFDRLFGSEDERSAAENRAKRLKYRKSILDFVADDSRRLQKDLGKRDQQKMDEFTTSVREIERRIDRARDEQSQMPLPALQKPEGIPSEFPEHMKLMWDLMALAFQMDLTRVSTLMVARDGSDRNFRFLGVTEGHHTLSHHGGNESKIEQIRKIDQFHVEQYAYFVQKLKSIQEGEGTLLDNCMVMLGSGIGDGNRHNHNDLPILLAGKGGGMITPGRHVEYPKNTPLCNLFVSMLNRMGADVDRFGDSDGKLGKLTA